MEYIADTFHQIPTKKPPLSIDDIVLVEGTTKNMLEFMKYYRVPVGASFKRISKVFNFDWEIK